MAMAVFVMLRSDQDAIEAVLHPYWPTITSVMEEIVGKTGSYAHRLSK